MLSLVYRKKLSKMDSLDTSVIYSKRNDDYVGYDDSVFTRLRVEWEHRFSKPWSVISRYSYTDSHYDNRFNFNNPL
jgi:hypothetical protein